MKLVKQLDHKFQPEIGALPRVDTSILEVNAAINSRDLFFVNFSI